MLLPPQETLEVSALRKAILGCAPTLTVGMAMRFSVKIIAIAVLALALVSAALFALSFSPQPASWSIPSPTPTPASSVSHMFDVDLVYAYVGKLNVTEHSHFGMEVHSANLYPVFIYINCTYLGTPNNESCDAKFEGYLVQLVSDTGVSASYTTYQGVELNESSYAWPAMPDADAIELCFNLTASESFLGRITDSGSFTSGDSSLGLWGNGPPSTITLSLQRIGWWTVKDGSISTISSPTSDDVLLHVQLEPFGDGFLYNKLVPENKLTEMDPFDPPV